MNVSHCTCSRWTFFSHFLSISVSVSVQLCERSKQSATHCHWRSVELKDGCGCLYKIAGLPVQTEMSYVVEGRSDGPNVFIVGFASELLEKKPSKMKFLFGLGCAISVAAFEFEEDEDEEDGDVAGNELDMKKFIPTHPLVATPMVSSISLAALAALQTPGSVSMGAMATLLLLSATAAVLFCSVRCDCLAFVVPSLLFSLLGFASSS